MGKIKLSLISGIIILICGYIITTASTCESQDFIQLGHGIKMDKGEFGFLYFDEDASIFFVETKNVPLEKGTFYGWRIHLLTDKEKVTWKELFILPGSPRVWGYKQGTEIDEQGKVATTEKTVSPKDGWIGHGWSVAIGDPPGTYVMKIYIEGFLAKTFTFEVK
jgi:hypothetical protein